MVKANRFFFQFAGIHAFLMGLLPFYIPVLLWQQGYALWQLSFFIALTGLGFLLAIPLWKNFYWNNQWNKILRISLILESLLFASVLFMAALPLSISLLIISLLNGAYLCFYWTSQRTLFTQLEQGPSNKYPHGAATGNNFGNFQIVVMVLLKAGILLSAFLLDQGLDVLLMVLSFFVALLGVCYLQVDVKAESALDVNLMSTGSTSTDSAVVLDRPSRIVFYLDGIFLYLESYFWLLSLYLVAQQDIMQLGVLVVLLTLLLSAVFWLIKSRIDAFPTHTVFQLAIIGYAISWLLRAEVGFDLDSAMSFEVNYPLILLIAFLTSFFRLSFNKRFFDHARLLRATELETNEHIPNQALMINYLLDKSNLSQLGIFVFFSVLGITLFGLSMTNPLSIPATINSQLSWIYTVAAPLVLLYGFYTQPRQNTQGRPSCIR